MKTNEQEQKIKEEFESWKDVYFESNRGFVLVPHSSDSKDLLKDMSKAYLAGRMASIDINEAKRLEALDCLKNLYSLPCSWGVKNEDERKRMNDTIKAFLENLGEK